MDKIVNIEVRNPIRGFRTPLGIGKYYNVKMPVNDIFTCICGRALVDEILPNGSLLRLDLTNYYKDNSASVVVTKEEKVEIKTPAAPAADPEAPKAEDDKTPAADDSVETKTEEKKDDEVTAPTVDPEAPKAEDEVPAAEAPVETKVEETAEEKKGEEVEKDAPKPSQKNRSNKSNKPSHK